MPATEIYLLPKYDPLDPKVMENPYPTYAKLREIGPLCRGGTGRWVVTRYAEVSALLGDRRLAHHLPQQFHQFSLGEGLASEFSHRMLIHRDPPEHTRLRGLMSAAFHPSAVKRMSGHIGSMIDGLLEPVYEKGFLDVVSDLAFPLPVLIICELIGIPAEDRHEVGRKAIELCKVFSPVVPYEDRAAANATVGWLRDYVGRLIDTRRKRPTEDLLSQMLQAAAQDQEKSTDDEIIDNTLFLFLASFETSIGVIATGCAALLKFPDQLERLRRDPSLVSTAVEEFMRYDSPLQSVGRLVLDRIEIGGRVLKKDRLLMLLIGSANHDETEFKDPERLDVGRKPNPHLAFGGGVHYCLGAALARLEAAATFSRLVERFSAWEPAGQPVRRPSALFRSYASVPMRVKPA
jgi:cytochrome P450